MLCVWSVSKRRDLSLDGVHERVDFSGGLGGFLNSLVILFLAAKLVDDIRGKTQERKLGGRNLRNRIFFAVHLNQRVSWHENPQKKPI